MDILELKIPKVVSNFGLPIIGLGDFVEKDKMRTTPKELFNSGNIEYAVVIGNHDYEVYKRLPRGREMKRVFYSNSMENKTLKKLHKNGFGTWIDDLESILDVRIFHEEAQNTELYFMHIPPPKEVVNKIVKYSKKNKIFLFCGHVHGMKNVRVSSRWYGQREVVEFTIPTFLEHHKMYLVRINGKSIELTEIALDVTTEEINYTSKPLSNKFGGNFVRYI